MSEYGWQLDRTPDGIPAAMSDAFLMRCFDIICDTRNSLMMEERNKTIGKRHAK
jgi:hypothetical protein